MGNIKTKPATPKTMYQKDEFNDDAILDYNLDSRDLAQAFIRAGDALDRVHKIEVHLRRAYNRTFDRLQKLQRDRRKPPSPISSPRNYDLKPHPLPNPAPDENERTGEAVVRDQEENDRPGEAVARDQEEHERTGKAVVRDQGMDSLKRIQPSPTATIQTPAEPTSDGQSTGAQPPGREGPAGSGTPSAIANSGQPTLTKPTPFGGPPQACP